MAGAIYTDVISRFESNSATAVVSRLVDTFRRAGEDASKAMGSAFSLSGMRAELAAAEADVKRMRDAETEAARVMVKANNDIEVATRRAAEVTAKFGETSSQAARAIGAQTDAEMRAAIATNKYADSMLATEAAAKKATAAHTETATAVGVTSNAFNKLGAGALVVAGGTILETGKMAGHLQQQMLKLGSTAGETGDLVGGHFTGNLQTVQNGILSLMGSTGYSADQLGKAMYTIESAGYRGTDGLKILTAAAQGASSEQADLAQVVDGLTTSMMDFGVTPDKAAQLMSKMVAATGEAKVTFQEFAGALHSVEPAAAAAGLKLEDIWGTLAQMTQSGMSADQSAVDMNQAITSLARPNSAQAARMKQLNISPDDVSQHLKDRGLAGTMQYLYGEIGKQIDPSTGLVNTGDLAHNAAGLANLHGMLADTGQGAMSDQAKAAAQAYLNNQLTPKEMRKEIMGSDAADKKKLQQFVELTDAVNGFSSKLSKGRDTLETINAALGDVTGTAEAARVAFQTTGQQADDTNERIKRIAEADLDPDGKVKGFTKSQEGFDAKMRDVKGGFEALGISLGETFLPALDHTANGLHDVVDFMSSHESVVKDMAIAVGALGTAWGTWKTIQGIRTVVGGVIDGFTSLLGVADRVMGGISEKVISAEGEFGNLGTAAGTAASEVETAATAEAGAQAKVKTAAAEANAPMGTERAAAAQAGVAGVQTASDEEVLAQGKVKTAATETNTALDAGLTKSGSLLSAMGKLGGLFGGSMFAADMLSGHDTPTIIDNALHGKNENGQPMPYTGPAPDLPKPGAPNYDQAHDTVVVTGGQGIAGLPGLLDQMPHDSHAAGGVFGAMPSRATIAPASGRGLVQWAEDSTGGESYIPLNGGQHSIDIWAQTGRLLGVFDQGGFRGDVDLSGDDMLGSYGPDVVSAAQRVGTAYSNALRDDCSGLVGKVVDDALGIAGDQLPTTQNMGQWLAERGFVPGVGGPGDISVGWYNHGSGIQDGHAAMTLSNGMNAESGGAHGNFLVGPGAAGASASEFDQHMYLPMAGGRGGGYAVDQEKVWRAQEHIQKLEDRISVLQEKISEETGKTKQSEKDRLDKELADAKRELEHAKGELAQAERGTYHAGRSGRRGSRSGGAGDELGGNLPEAFGLKEGLPGLVKYGITALADLAFAPAIGALEAVSQAAGGKDATGSGLMGFLGQQMGLGGAGGAGGGFGASLGGLGGAGGGMSDMLGRSIIGAASGMGPAPLGGGLGAVDTAAVAPQPGITADNMTLPMGMGSGRGMPGAGLPMGRSQTQIGGVAPASGTGSGFGGLGGLPMAGLQTAASSLDMLAPGAGQAAQVGIQLLNRGAAFAGQAGGIIAGGVMDALIPHESELAGKSWFTKLAGGLAGAKPELPNTAGDKPPAPQQQGGDTHIHNGDQIGVKIDDYHGKQGEDAAGADLARHQAATAASGTPRGGFFTG